MFNNFKIKKLILSNIRKYTNLHGKPEEINLYLTMLLPITRKEIRSVICDYPEEVKLTVVGFS
jgi:hypothetical protein